MEDIRKEKIQSIEGKINRVHKETQMQWIWIREEEEIGYAMYVESGAIWPKIIGKGTRGG